MLAFEVFLNGRKITLAGANDLGVLGSHVAASGRLGPMTAASKAHLKGYDLYLSVGGLTRRKNNGPNDLLDWIGIKKIKVGDEVLVRVRRVDYADPPTEVRPNDPKRSERAEREEFKWAKFLYLKLRHKYGRPKVKHASQGKRDKPR